LQIVSDGDSSATVSASRSQTLSHFREEEVPDISSMLYEPSLPISEHLMLLSLNSRQQNSGSNLGSASNLQQATSSQIGDNLGAQNSGSNLPSIIASLNNEQHDDNDLPTLPDILVTSFNQIAPSVSEIVNHLSFLFRVCFGLRQFI